jgi:hypothetical protein
MPAPLRTHAPTAWAFRHFPPRPDEAELLDAAAAVALFQLELTDLALSFFPPRPQGSILPLFASPGLVDTVLAPKPALAGWDSIYARPRNP